MTRYVVQEDAGIAIEEIYAYSYANWGEAQARQYIGGLFARIDDIAAQRFRWRAMPAELGIQGYYCRYERHLIYWHRLSNGSVGIAAVLHERMHSADRLRAAFED